MADFTMPSLGADMEEGTVSAWRVKPGDAVHRGDIVAVVDTEKSTIEVEIFEDGVVEELVVPEGERVPVGAVLAHVRAPGEAAGPPRAAVVAAAEAGPRAAVAPPEAAAPGAPRPVVHSPVIRRLAEQLGIDPATLHGTGPGGLVTRADVEDAARARAASGRREAPPRVPAAPAVPGRPAPVGARRAGRAPAGRPRSSPLARRLAAELGVDLAVLQGTGPDRSVTARDVRLAAGAPAAAGAPTAGAATAGAPPAPAAARGDGLAVRRPAAERAAALRHALGALMARSKREIPHYYLSTTIDAGAATAWLEEANRERPVAGRLVLASLLIKATARAVAKVPEMNGFFTDGAFAPSGPVHVGVAISLRTGGVIAPAIHDADRLPLDDLMATLRDLVGRARSGTLRSSEMSDPTITVTNLGELGVDAVFGVIYPPQVALVGFGQVTERPVARGGLVGARPCLTATLSADHRVSDGHRGGRFLAEIDRLLREPDQL